MLGVKGMDYLESVWEEASKRGCNCKSDRFFSQDFLGEVNCDSCKMVVISQDEVDTMEKENKLPNPNLSVNKLNNWFNR